MKEAKSILEAIGKIYPLLEDEVSKDIFMNRLAYLISGDYKYLDSIIGSYVRNRTFASLDFHDRAAELLSRLPKEQDFVLYGAGTDGAMFLPHVFTNKRFAGFCSSTKIKQKNGYLGFSVMSPEELLSRKDLCVIIATQIFRDEIMQILKDGGYPQELIFDGPAFYTPASSEMEPYFGPSFLKFRDEEIFVDAGCYNFGTSLAMAAHCKRLKVYAFEPDPENYQKCLKSIERRHTDRISDVKIFPYGTWSEHATLSFDMQASGGSHICVEDSGNNSVSVMPIDEAIDPGDQVTMIKMDVEGAELESLKGAEQTILRDKPKLAICIYHKVEDMWEIPLYIKNLVPEYRLYIRHHSVGPFETVLYAVMPE